MALTASSLIDAALKRSFGHTGSQKISKAMLLEEISYQDQLIVQMFSQIAPDLLATVTGTFDIVSATANSNGYSLNSGIHYRDFIHVDTTDDRYVEVNMVNRSDRQSSPSAPAAMISLGTGATGATFYPIDPLGKRWSDTTETRTWFESTDGHSISYSFVPLPSPITKLSDTVTSPNMAREAIVSSLELQILLSSHKQNEARIQGAFAKRQGAMDALRMQAYKFMAPQGQPGGRYSQNRTDQAWVNSQVG